MEACEVVGPAAVPPAGVSSCRVSRGERSARMGRARAPLMLAVGAVLWLPSAALAAGAGGGEPMPWEGPLNRVLTSFTGPVAQALCILAVVVLGFSFAFSEGGGGLRKVLGVLLGVSIAVTATTFGVTFFGFDGGAGF